MKKYFVFFLLIIFFSCDTQNPLPKNYLKIASKQEPCWMDPRKGVSMTSSPLHHMVFEGLLKMDHQGDISPGMALSYEISSDRTLYTFHIDPKARWSNGAPLFAKAFEASWKKILDPSFLSKDAYLLYPIKNAEKAHLHGGSLDEVGIYSPDDHTLVVELESPYPPFLEVVTLSAFAPVNQEIDQANPKWAQNASKDFVGNGPFILKKWVHGSQMVFEKNPHYLRKNRVKIPGIVVNILSNEMAYLRLFMKGECDFIGSALSPIPASAYPSLLAKGKIKTREIGGTKILSFNVNHSLLANRHFRRALNYSVNRKEIVENLTHLQEPIATRAIPNLLSDAPSLSFFKDADDQKALEEFALAKDLLQLDTQKTRPKITLTYYGSRLNDLISQQIKDRWEALFPISVELEKVPLKMILNKIQNRSYEICLCAYISELKNPINILERFHSKKNLRNYPGWEHPDYQKLYETLSSSETPERFFEQLEKILMEEAPFAPIYHYKYAHMYSDRVQNIQISPLGDIFFDQASIRSE